MSEQNSSSASAKKKPSEGSNRRRSSFLANARASFVRSKGTRGANVETLRGTTGSDFEGNARVERCNAYGEVCGCLAGRSKSPSKKPKLLLIKGHSCFVFSNEDSSSPKYAIDLTHMTAEIDQQHHHHHTTDVLFRSSLGDVEYKFMFDTSKKEDENAPKEFVDVVTGAAADAKEEIIKTRLGHAHLLKKRASAKYADSVANTKVKDQPDAPIGIVDAMAGIPTAMETY